MEPNSDWIEDPQQLDDAVARAFPDCGAYIVSIHHRTVVTLTLLRDCGSLTSCRFSYGRNGIWTLIPLWPL